MNPENWADDLSFAKDNREGRPRVGARLDRFGGGRQRGWTLSFVGSMRLFGLLGLGLGGLLARAEFSFGPAWSEFGLTLRPGEATEGLGPIWGSEHSDGSWLWRVSPFVSHLEDPATQRSEYEVLYPIYTYDRFGGEYAARFLQLFEFTGSTTPDEEARARTTVFPFYFYQKSTSPTNGYLAVLPFYGHLRNRLFRDEVSFVLAPLWVSSTKRGVQTDNVLFPFFHWNNCPWVFTRGKH